MTPMSGTIGAVEGHVVMALEGVAVAAISVEGVLTDVSHQQEVEDPMVMEGRVIYG